MKNKLSQMDIDFIVDGVCRFLKGISFKVILFGSFVSGKIRKTSDIDVGILSPKPLDLAAVGYIKEYFEESDFPHAIDIVDLTRVDPSFRDKILARGKVIYAAND